MQRLLRYVQWSALGLFIYMPFHIFLSQWLSTVTGGLDAWKVAKDVFTALLVSTLVVLVLLKRKQTQLYFILLLLAVLYLLLHLLLFITTHQPTQTGLLATTYNNRLIWYVIIGYSLSLLLPSQNGRTYIKVLLGISTAVCLIALAQWLLPKDIMTHFGYSVDRGVKPNFFIDDKPDLPRVFSTLRDPNSLGAFLILPIVLLVDSLLRFWRSQKRQLLIGLLLLHGLILFLTFSRSAWVGTFLGVVSLLAIRYGRLVLRNFRRLLIPGLALLLILGIGIYVLRDQYVVQNVVFHSDENTKQTDSNNLHSEYIQKGLRGIADQPLGHGPGTAGLVSTKLPNGLLTENYYIQIGYEVGIVGLAIFLAFLYMVLRFLWKQRKDSLVQVLLASFVGVAFMNMLLHTWSNEAVSASWFMLAGIFLVKRRNFRRTTLVE